MIESPPHLFTGELIRPGRSRASRSIEIGVFALARPERLVVGQAIGRTAFAAAVIRPPVAVAATLLVAARATTLATAAARSPALAATVAAATAAGAGAAAFAAPVAGARAAVITRAAVVTARATVAVEAAASAPVTPVAVAARAIIARTIIARSPVAVDLLRRRFAARQAPAEALTLEEGKQRRVDRTSGRSLAVMLPVTSEVAARATVTVAVEVASAAAAEATATAAAAISAATAITSATAAIPAISPPAVVMRPLGQRLAILAKGSDDDVAVLAEAPAEGGDALGLEEHLVDDAAVGRVHRLELILALALPDA